MEELNDLVERLEVIKSRGWIKSGGNGYAGVGLTLEQELNITPEDYEIPDFGQIELKTKQVDSEPYITLFSATPDSYLYEIKRLHKEYGYPHSKYPEFKVFNMAFYGNKFISVGNRFLFKLFVDFKKKQVILQVYDVYTRELIDDKCAWSFELLKEKLERKLKYLMFVEAERKYSFPHVYFKYINYNLYILKNFDEFLKAIQNGTIRVTFKINVFRYGHKQGQIHDHGTSFDIMKQDLESIYYKV